MGEAQLMNATGPNDQNSSANSNGTASGATSDNESATKGKDFKNQIAIEIFNQFYFS